MVEDDETEKVVEKGQSEEQPGTGKVQLVRDGEEDDGLG
jgi:hypothetical protein